jgi:NAD(P)-dependent dehydrogenase (short-subunit alcohol dehydrogenase family)
MQSTPKLGGLRTGRRGGEPVTHFSAKTSVITGAGSGIGRELTRQLAASGCRLAICDLSRQGMEETLALCRMDGSDASLISLHVADVSEPDQVAEFETEVSKLFDHLNLLFNNAGIGGGASFVTTAREEWEKTFNVCWGGVYNVTRAFMPLLQAAPEARIINVASVNGLWAALLPGIPMSAYSAAKFAVRGFTESLILDLRLNAPHIKCSLVLPGYVGSDILANSDRILASVAGPADEASKKNARQRIVGFGGSDPAGVSDADLGRVIDAMARHFQDHALTSPSEAARTILEGVRQGQWRILVGPDARIIDAMVRAEAADIYEPAFIRRMAATIDATPTPGGSS